MSIRRVFCALLLVIFTAAAFAGCQKSAEPGIIRAAKYGTEDGRTLDPGVPAWGGHQSRVARNKLGVFATVLTDSGNAASEREFVLLRIDTEKPELVGSAKISGQAVSLVTNEAGELFVLCLTTGGEVTTAYGAPTVFKFTYGRDGVEKFQHPQTSLWNSGGCNYEAVTIDKNGVIYFLMPRIGDASLNANFYYMTFDTKTSEWTDSVKYDMPIAYLYPYLLPRGDGGVNVIAQIGTYYEYLGLSDPSGTPQSSFLVNSLKLWRIPDFASADNVTEKGILEIPVTQSEQRPVVQNSSAGDSFMDSKGYTHVITYANGGESPKYTYAMMYYVFDESNNLIKSQQLFGEMLYARFAESRSGRLYLITMVPGSKDVSVYRANDDHTSFEVEAPYLTATVPVTDGLSTYSGLQIASARGGTATENYVDCVYPADGAYATTWVYFRLQLE